MTNYTATHSAGDIASITVDFIVELGIFLVSFATLIGLVLLFAWLKKNVR